MRTRLGYQGPSVWIRGVIGYEIGIVTTAIAEAWAETLSGVSALTLSAAGTSSLTRTASGASALTLTLTGDSPL